jgi:hypothetical protein
MQRVGLIARGNRHIGAKPQNVVLVDPDEIRVLLRARVALETSERGLNKMSRPISRPKKHSDA